MRKFKAMTSNIMVSLDDVIKEGELEDIVRQANKPVGRNLQLEVERQVQAENEADRIDS